MNTLRQRQLQVHVPIVGWLLILEHALLLLIGIFVFVLLLAIGLAVQEEPATAILGSVGAGIGILLAALALPGLVSGIGLLLHQGWARILATVLAFLGMVNIPLGTLIGVYAIWVLLQDEATEYFAGGTQSTGQAS